MPAGDRASKRAELERHREELKEIEAQLARYKQRVGGKTKKKKKTHATHATGRQTQGPTMQRAKRHTPKTLSGTGTRTKSAGLRGTLPLQGRPVNGSDTPTRGGLRAATPAGGNDREPAARPRRSPAPSGLGSSSSARGSIEILDALSEDLKSIDELMATPPPRSRAKASKLLEEEEEESRGEAGDSARTKRDDAPPPEKALVAEVAEEQLKIPEAIQSRETSVTNHGLLANPAAARVFETYSARPETPEASTAQNKADGHVDEKDTALRTASSASATGALANGAEELPLAREEDDRLVDSAPARRTALRASKMSPLAGTRTK